MSLKVLCCSRAWASLENVRTDVKIIRNYYIVSTTGASKTLAKVELWLSIADVFGVCIIVIMTSWFQNVTFFHDRRPFSYEYSQWSCVAKFVLAILHTSVLHTSNHSFCLAFVYMYIRPQLTAK